MQREIGGVLVDVIADTGRAKATYVYSEVWAAVMRLVDAGLLDSFRVWRQAESDGRGTVNIRLYAFQTFLRVAVAALRRLYDRSREVSIFGSHPPSDLRFRQDLMEAALGDWDVEALQLI